MEEEKMGMAREMVRRQDVTTVLEEHGVTEDEFLRWLEDGDLAAYLYRMARLRAMVRIPRVWQRLEQLVADGEVRAIKLYCDLCEKMQGESAGDAPNFVNPEVEAARRVIFGDE